MSPSKTASGRRSKNTTTDSANTTKSSPQLRNPVTHHFEFLGPYLTPLVIAALTVLPTTLNGLCGGGDDQQCPPSWVYTLEWGDNLASGDVWQHTQLVEQIGLQLTKARILRAVMVVCGWMSLHACLYYLVPGRWIKGTQIRDGAVLTYPINAFGALIASYALIAGLSAVYGPALLYWVADNTLSLCAASTLLCLLQSGLLYSYSFRVTTELPEGPLLAEGGNSGYPLYDFFIGRELNPRVGSFDFKYFCELRPGLIGWTVLNAANAVRQGVSVSGVSIETVTWPQVFGGIGMSMWLVLAFQFYYVVDALWNEAAILTTMDITADGFGFMLNFGDLAWVPFTYSLQSRYLAMHPVALSPLAITALITLKLTGLYIFRGSNGQKNAFRTNPSSPSCAHLKYLETKSGSKLLISGWWGVARHVNYTGDWLMALSWCLPTGFGSVLPYFYAIYFVVLLWHREMRDEHKCKAKYGKDWDRYCQVVKYRFIPGIY
ncbi:erg24, C-14 sterol reductase [Chytriomyces hyalinus]|nr:erg24, C-14 sterol reductase [Chytriomyces hyalinus]